jgi:hypothetical protein
MHRSFARLLVAGGMTIGLALGLTVSSVSSAAAVTAPAPGSTVPCTSGPNSFCFAPQVTYVGPASQCGSMDYSGTSDANGVPTAWTYANGATRCTTVTYDGPVSGSVPANAPCSLYFYDPAGHATATFTLWANLSPPIGIPVNENPGSGWVFVTTVASLDGFFQFGDTGQSYPAQIAWGTSATHSLWVIC